MMQRILINCIAVIVVCMSCMEAALAQRALGRRLESATRVECRFTTQVTGNWDGAEATAAVSEVDFEAAFFDISVEDGSAEAEGQFGAALVVVRYAEGYLHFLQTFYGGPLYVTTVLANETSDGRLKAVHTRHEFTPTVIPGYTSRPEMYVGDCEVS